MKWKRSATTEEEMPPIQRWWHQGKNLCEECHIPYGEQPCGTPGCGKKVHANGLCGACGTAKWREDNPEKLEEHKKIKRDKGREHTLTLDFSKNVGSRRSRTDPGRGNHLQLYEDLIEIAKEELRPLLVQAMYFIKIGVERHKEEKENEKEN